MTTPTRHPNHPQAVPQQITCSVCHREIPSSAAFTPEGADYVGHFCGIECYERFASQQIRHTNTKPVK